MNRFKILENCLTLIVKEHNSRTLQEEKLAADFDENVGKSLHAMGRQALGEEDPLTTASTTCQESSGRLELVRFTSTLPLNDGEDEVLRSIIPFCFPDSGGRQDCSLSGTGMYHEFVLTDEIGRKKYISCYKRLCGSDGLEWECRCLVSAVPRLELMKWCLGQIVASPDGSLDRIFIDSCAILEPPQNVSIRIINGNKHFDIRGDCPLDFNLALLLQTVSIPVVVKIICLLLQEKSVFLISSSCSLITRLCEMIIEILNPLKWNNVHVPLIPEQLKDLIQAPTVFLMGGHSSWAREHVYNLCKHKGITGSETSVAVDSEEFRFHGFDLDTCSHFSNDNDVDIAAVPCINDFYSDIRILFNQDFEYFDQIVPNTRSLEHPSNSSIIQVFSTWIGKIFSGSSDTGNENILRYYRQSDFKCNDQKWILSHSKRYHEFYANMCKSSMVQQFIESLVYLSKPEFSHDFRARVHQQIYDAWKVPGLAVTDISNTVQKMTSFNSISLYSSDVVDFSVNLNDKYEEIMRNLDKSGYDAFLLMLKCRIMIAHSHENLTGGMAILQDAYEATIKAPSGIRQISLLKEILQEIEMVSGLCKTYKLDIPRRPSVGLSEENIKTTKASTMGARKISISMDNPFNTTMSDSAQDKLVLNCNPKLQSRVIDSTDTIDSVGLDIDMSVDDLDSATKALLQNPVKLSIQLTELIFSMFQVVSATPSCQQLSLINVSKMNTLSMGSLQDLGSSPIELFKKKPSSNNDKLSDIEKQLRQDHYVLDDASKLKLIKKMPSYELFKKQLLLLRWVDLDQGLHIDEEKLAFWLNVRHILLLHALVEFGIPITHRITFLRQKPVYIIAGSLFSLNDITYGILMHDLPLPSYLKSNNSPTFNTSKLTQPTSSGAPGIALVEVTASSSYKRPEANMTSSREHLPGAAITIDTKCLKFPSTDPRTKLLLQQTNPLVVFCLADGSRCGPRLRIYKRENIQATIYGEAARFIDSHIDVDQKGFKGSLAGADQPSSLFSWFGKSIVKKKRLTIPQYLSWYHFRRVLSRLLEFI